MEKPVSLSRAVPGAMPGAGVAVGVRGTARPDTAASCLCLLVHYEAAAYPKHIRVGGLWLQVILAGA